jgi:hypothetical protein
MLYLHRVGSYFYFLCRAQRLQCLNADWPDLYGHYREAKFTQTKHHWWWKANRVFDQLKATRSYNGKGLRPILNFAPRGKL